MAPMVKWCIRCFAFFQVETSRPKSKTKRFRFKSPEHEARKVGVKILVFNFDYEIHKK